MMSRSLAQLVGLLSVFTLERPEDVREATVDAATEGFDAELAGIVCDGSIITATGLGGRIDKQAFVALAGQDDDVGRIDPLGEVHLIRVPIEGKASTQFVVARTSDPFDHEDVMLARAMVRVMRLAVRTIGAFDEQDRARADADERAAENRSLADRVQRRHAELMTRLSRIQRMVTGTGGDTDTLDAITAEAGRLFDGDQVGVRLIDPEDPRIAGLRHASNIPPDVVASLDRSLAADGVTGAAMAADRLVVSARYGADPRRVDAMVGIGVSTIMAAPSTAKATSRASCSSTPPTPSGCSTSRTRSCSRSWPATCRSS